MNRSGYIYVQEAKAMTQFILEGHNEQETADEFDASRETVQRRLKMLGYTYADLVEFREARNKKEAIV